MNRKEFLRTSSTLAAAGLIAPIGACKEVAKKETVNEARTNWAGNYSYKAKELFAPKNVEELQSLLKSNDVTKALGSRHCFNDIADSPISQISTKNLNKLVGIDEKSMTVTVESGVRYGDISPHLHMKGYALHNLASLPHISVAGACATGTHGSGIGVGNLSSAVRGIELITGDGSVVEIGQDHEHLNALVVGLGAFGIISKVTLAIEPTFTMRQDIFQDIPLKELADNFESIMSAGYSVSLFTDWMDEKVSQVWIKRKFGPEVKDLGQEFYGGTAATRDLHPITELSAENCTEQMGKEGPWWDRLPHFKMGFTPSSGDELQAEFFVPIENAVEALLAIEKKKEQIYPHLYISEIRSIAADDLWMSPSYQRDSIAIHFTLKPHPKEVQRLLPIIEQELAPYGVRPHWGKLFTIDSKTLLSRYPRAEDFLAMVGEYDPEGKFRNAYLDRVLYNKEKS